MKTVLNRACILSVFLFAVSGCTDLSEELFGSLTPDTYYTTEEEAISSLVGVYQRMGTFVNWTDTYRVAVEGTDEFVIGALATGGWYDGGKFHELTSHQPTPTNTALQAAWNGIFAVVGAANAVIDAFQNSAQSGNLVSEIAEVRTMRAFAYYIAMDFFGNVPVFTEARVDPSNLPATNSRDEVFKFVETELLEAMEDLPSITEVNRSEYYPRFTRETAQAILALVYLNAEVYTGTPRWTDAITMSDHVINSGGYILEPDYFTNFRGDNHNSREFIASIALDPALNAGGTAWIRAVLHPQHSLTYNLPFAPANGPKTYQVAVDRYENHDVRKKQIIFGPQFDADGNPLPRGGGDPSQLVLIPLNDAPDGYRSLEDNEGARVLKYIPDGNWVGRDSSHDLPIIRYSEILLTKAEALFRTGAQDEALELVNEVRERAEATPFTTLTLKDIEEERARELIYEGQRRRDMIRFGSYFTGTWKYKRTVTPEWKGIYPIPQPQLDGNPNLKQNPQYD